MEKYEFVKGMNENKIMVSKDGSRFIATTEMSGNNRQVLVFYCNRSGNVTDWTPVDADSSIQSFMNSKVRPAIVEAFGLDERERFDDDEGSETD